MIGEEKMKKNISKNFIFISLALCSYLYAVEQVKLDDIVLSASKTEENLQNISQTVTVIDKEELEEKEIKTIADVIKEIPNMTSRYLYFDTVNFRGLNTSTFTNNNPVVIYIDGIPHSNKFGYNASLVNVERIEILRGPQGTLYGKDSIGGVINIVTKTPTNEYHGEVGTEYGTDNYQDGLFNLSGPIIKDVLFFGLNGRFSKSDGWITNHNDNLNEDADRNNAHNLNTNFLYKPSENFSARLDLSHDKDNRYWIQGGIIPSINLINSYSRENFEDANYDTDTFTKIVSTSQALNLSYDFNNINISSTTTNKKVDIDGNYDYDWKTYTPYANLSKLQYSQSETQTQELRFSNKNDSFKWVMGLYYENEKFNNERYGTQRPVNTEINAVSETQNQTYAAFGEITVPLIDKLDLTLGGRAQRINKNIDLNYYMGTIGNNANPMYILNDEHTWNAFLPKAGLAYHINDDLTSYLTISKGYMPGGYNYYSYSGDAEDNRFNEQTSTNYELGIRGNFFDNSLYLASSIFYMDIDDIHVYTYDASTGFSYVSNAAKAHSQGMEIELKYSIANNWMLESAIGFTRAQYDEYSSNKNNKIENTPSFTTNIGLSYYNPRGYYGRFDVQTQGDVYFDAANSIKQDAYAIANVKVGYRFDNWNIYTYVKNITDKSYLTTVKSDVGGYLATFGQGRFVGVGVKYTF